MVHELLIKIVLPRPTCPVLTSRRRCSRAIPFPEFVTDSSALHYDSSRLCLSVPRILFHSSVTTRSKEKERVK